VRIAPSACLAARRLALLLTTLAACDRAPEEGAILLGASGPWNEGYARMNRRGIELALEEINESRRSSGDTVAIVFRND
jgi:hypothetical protein